MIFNSSVIFVKDIEIAKSFYTRLLGCTIEHDFGKKIIFHNGPALRQIQDNHTIARQLKISDGSNRFELYFETESPDKDHKLLTDAGVKFLHEIKKKLGDKGQSDSSTRTIILLKLETR
jgi:catechol 2,3-dioxygenase-like lactoylglutathione lyase family enzyme